LITRHNQIEKNCFSVLFILTGLGGLVLLSGCASDKVEVDSPEVAAYQEQLVEKAPDKEFLKYVETLTPEVSPEPTNGVNQTQLSVEEAVKRVLANNPDITVVSFDPSIAKEEITQSLSAFDPLFYSEFNYEDQDDPTDSIYLGGQVNSRIGQAGIRQRGITGAEWSLGYALTRTDDDLTTRVLPVRYEPIATFQIRQPLLRDGWQQVNLAGVNIAKLTYSVALASFREEVERSTTEMLSFYWTLKRARMERDIQLKLLEQTREALKRVLDRKEIDASQAQIKQAETSLKRREAFLQDIEKSMNDVQDQLLQTLADSQTSVATRYEIIPSAEFTTNKPFMDTSEMLRSARMNNPAVIRARLGVEVTQINVDVAKHQKMPKLDLVASTRISGLDESSSEAHEVLYDHDYTSYAVGLTFEMPLDNRQRKAEYRKRILEHSKAKSQLWSVSDQVAVGVKEAVRSIETAYDQILIQQESFKAASAYLQALEDTEVIRKQLTPEFLLVKLQAQEALAEAARGEIRAKADYSIALIRLAQTTGTVLDMRYVQNAMPELPPSSMFDETEKSISVVRLREEKSNPGEEPETSDASETDNDLRILRLR
jgi:outer membrane protein TolC